MSDNRIDIGIGVDAAPMKPGIAEAKREIQGLGNELGNAVAKGSEKAVRSVKSLGGEMGNAVAGGADKASRSIDALIQKMELRASLVGKSSREIQLMELAQRGATAAQLKAADAALGTVEAFKKQQSEARKAAAASEAAARTIAASQALAAGKLNANQKQQLGFQLNDLFVQIAGGQSAITAFIQQGSQLNGTFGGMGGTLRALTSLFTVTRVVVGGLAGAFATLGYAAYAGMQQSRDFSKAIALTGNAAGVTEGQFNSLAETIASSTSTSVGSAREALQGLVASGQLSGAALTETARATQMLSKATGQSTEDVVKQFVGMADGVGKWAETTNKSYHFVTAAQLDYIKTLEDQGNREKAIEVTMQALIRHLGGVKDNLGYLEEGWRGLKREAANAWDAMLGIGRADTIEGTLAKAKTRLAELQGPLPLKGASLGDQIKGIFGGDSFVKDQIASQQSLVNKLEESKNLAQDVAKRSASHAKIEEAKTGWMKLQEQTLSKQQKMQKELADANAKADAAGISNADRQGVLANIRDKYKEAKGAKGPDLRKSEMNVDLERLRADMQTQLSIYQGAESILEATRSAGLLSEKEYYEAKRSFVSLNMESQVAELEQENKILAATKVSAAAQLENQKKIADNQGKIAQLKADAAAKGVILDIQQKSAMDQVTRSYQEARMAAQQYFDTTQKQYARELASVGKGNVQRARDSGVAQITDRYQGQRDDLNNNKTLLELEGKFTEEARKQYESRLGIINEFQAKAIASYESFYDDMLSKQRDWSLGASEALQNYYDESQNVFAGTANLFTDAFRGAEDALVKFSTTGKLSFKDLISTINADIARIAVRESITGPLAGWLKGQMAGMGGILGGSGSNASSVADAAGSTAKAAADAANIAAITTQTAALTASIATETAAAAAMATLTSAAASAAASLATVAATGAAEGGGDVIGSLIGSLTGTRAIGGPVSSGGLYQVNERGPELLSVAGKSYLMMGNQSGQVTPTSGMGGGGGNTYHMPIYVTPPPGSNAQTAQQWGAMAGRQMQTALRRNG